MKIQFASGINAWQDFENEVHSIILKNGFKNIAEIGGGANPLLSIDFVKNNLLIYHVMDVSVDELEKADTRYKKIALDL